MEMSATSGSVRVPTWLAVAFGLWMAIATVAAIAFARSVRADLNEIKSHLDAVGELADRLDEFNLRADQESK